MSISGDVIEQLPRVEGLLNYLAPMAEKPMNLTYESAARRAALDWHSGTACHADS
jgi:hypothetical protein